MKFQSVMIAALVVAGFNTAISAQQNNDFKTEVVGLTIYKPKKEDGFESHMLGRSAGISILTRISSEKHHFIGFGKRDTIKLELKDNKGKELSRYQDSQSKEYMFQIDDDGKSAVIAISGGKMPSEGASSLSASGSFELVTGKDLITVESKWDYKKGAKGKLGDVPFEIVSLEKAFNPRFESQFQFETKKSMDAISAIKFLDEDGAEIEAEKAGSSSFGFGDNYTYTQSYYLKKAPKVMTMQVSYFKSTENVTVPVKFSTGLDMNAK